MDLQQWPCPLRPFCILAIATFLFTGCSTTTRSLNVNDDRSNAFTLDAEYKINKWFGISGGVSYQQGTDDETIEGFEVVQIEGNQFVSNEIDPLSLDYDFDFTTAIFSADFYPVDTARYTLILSPSASYTSSNVDVEVEGTNLSINQDDFRPGFQIRQDFPIKRKFNVNLDLGLYDERSDATFVQSRVGIDYRIYRGLSLSFGFINSRLLESGPGTGFFSSNDECTPSTPLEECSDSIALVTARGFNIGFKGSF